MPEPFAAHVLAVEALRAALLEALAQCRRGARARAERPFATKPRQSDYEMPYGIIAFLVANYTGQATARPRGAGEVDGG